MKSLLFILISSSVCFSQKHTQNFITYSNYANEAEYYFHEGIYDTATIYFEEAFKYSKEQHPTHQKLYAYSLFQIGERKAAIKILSQKWSSRSIDTIWFPGLTIKERALISKKRMQIKETHKPDSFYRDFMDSLMIIDQAVRQRDRDENFYLEKERQDSSNALAIISFTKTYGFPAGKNAGWYQRAATFLLHMSPEFYADNYALLISEVIKGNLEPWMLARGIDRMYTVEIGEEKINPYNRYWSKSIIDPFLMFQNCISLGVSPYYDYNWSTKPKKTIHFDYYKENKKYYNTIVMYTHNIN
ncbi:MAG: hypothetical protein MK066_13240 [Crocinitomicaceae bacterium]|nr:hypothetical protein [Crocinitomicaceae bacterium]